MRTVRWRLLSLGLILEMLSRTTSYLWYDYDAMTSYQQLTQWSPPFLIAGGILIAAGSVRRRPMNVEHFVAGAGHLLGLMFTANFALALVLGAVLQGTSWASAPAVGFVAVFHGLRIYDCLRRVQWTRASSVG